MRGKCIALVLLSVFFLAGCTSKGRDVSKGTSAGLVIANGREVTLHYTLSVDGKVIDSSKGGAPLMYKQGSQQIIPGLARQLEGMHVGDKKSITVVPQEGYGNVNPNAIKEVQRSYFPANSKPDVGMTVEVKSKEGQKFHARISEVKKDTVVLDFNHSLAGKMLHFDVEIVSIN